MNLDIRRIFKTFWSDFPSEVQMFFQEPFWEMIAGIFPAVCRNFFRIFSRDFCGNSAGGFSLKILLWVFTSHLGIQIFPEFFLYFFRWCFRIFCIKGCRVLPGIQRFNKAIFCLQELISKVASGIFYTRSELD